MSTPSTTDYVRELRAVVGTRPVNLVGAAGLVLNAAGEVLLQRRPSGRWSVLGGNCELGEAWEDALHRELLEESGLSVHSAELLGLVSGQETFTRLAHGDEFYMYTAVYAVRGWSGTPVADGSEGLELRFFALDALPSPLGPVGRRMAELLAAPA